MKAYDFEYDGITLSEMGYMICDFSSQSLQTISAGSEISFNTVSTMSGTKYELVNTEFTSCLETTFQICKDDCKGYDLEITNVEIIEMMRWLNREKFRKFRLLDDEYINVYFEGSFNISRLELEGITVGLELTFTTNRPFALKDERIFNFTATADSDTFSIIDPSDREGFIYPKTVITISEGGDFSMYNAFEDRTTIIENCTAGEVITMDYPIISSSLDSHAIQNDFNWVFFRVANTYKSRKNTITVSLPSKIKVTYSPVAKIGF